LVWFFLLFLSCCFYVFFIKRKIDTDSNIEIERRKRKNMSCSLSAHHYLASEIIQEVKSDACVSLHYEKLAVMLELVLDNPEVINILRKTPIIQTEREQEYICFETAYQTHIIEGKKGFELMTPMNSFALSWLHCLYH